MRRGALLAAAVLAAACGRDTSGLESARRAAAPRRFAMSSPAFADGATIPRRHTADGEDLSPALRWEAPPAGTVEVVLVCHDPDAPRPEGWTHWVLAGIPPTTRQLPEGVDAAVHPTAAPAATHGKNDFGNLGYGGPSPPPGHGVHHYHFVLEALDRPSGLGSGASRSDVARAIRGHVIGRAEIVGTYERR